MLKSDSLQTTITAYNLNHQAVAASGEFLLYPIKYGQSAADAKKSEPAYSAPFTAHEVTSLAAWNNLPSGKYLIVTQPNDSEGKLATYVTENTLFALTDKCPPVQSYIWEYAENTAYDAANPASVFFCYSI